MIAHDHVGVDAQSFGFTTKIKAFNYNISVLFSGKYVNPTNNGAGYEIHSLLVKNAISAQVFIVNIRFFSWGEG
jgi:hypothetical protein